MREPKSTLVATPESMIATVVFAPVKRLSRPSDCLRSATTEPALRVASGADALASAPLATLRAGSVVADLKQSLGLDNRFTGANTTVAIIDSGVATNVDFGSRILAQYVFLNGRRS